MQGPTVSIVTPSYNTGRYLGAAVRSVLDQDWPDLEYLVLDGESTDDSVEVLKSFSDPRYAWVSEKDEGQSDAVNKGVARSRGEVIGWLNSDDTYTPGAVRAAAEFLREHPEVDAVYGNATYTDASGGHIAPCVNVEPFSKHRLMHYTDFIVQPATFFRRRAFEAVGGVDQSLHWCMDYDLWLKMVSRGFRFAHLPRVLANFRWLADNKTATGRWGRLREIEKVVARYATGTHGYLRLEMVNLHLGEAAAAARRGRLLAAAASSARAAGTFLSSARAVRSVFQPQTWKVTWTGQVLRKRALAADGRKLRHK